MKIKIQSDDASIYPGDPWSQMDDWLAELRDDSRTESPGDEDAETDGAGVAWSDAPAQAAPAEARVRARAGARAEADVRAQAGTATGAIERAVIGDQLRIPIMWCELGSCVSWYMDRAALGEADTRARAIDAGWRIDALGRLTCPSCQQTDPRFWAACRVVPWDRYAAMVRAARVAAAPGDGAVGSTARDGSGDHGRAVSAAASQPEPAWRRAIRPLRPFASARQRTERASAPPFP
jgi:hypothetical protein